MPRITTILCVLAFLQMQALPALAQSDEQVINAPEAGFTLTIPDVGWTQSVQRGADGISSISVGPASAGGAIALSIQPSAVADSSAEAIQAHVETLKAAVTNDASISDLEDHTIEIAGKTAWGIRAHQEAMGQMYKVYVVFLRDRGFQYRVQFHAPRDVFDEHWPNAREVLDGFALTELDTAAQEKIRLRGLAARCGSLVEWAPSWTEAATRATDEQRLIVVSIFAQPGFQLGNALDEGVFMDPEVIALVEHRFVACRWKFGDEAPFVDHNVFGLSATTFGVGLLVCAPDGTVLRQVFIPEADVAIHTLREVLAAHPDLAPAPEPESATHATRAAFLIDSGQLDLARELLTQDLVSDRSADVAFQRARLHRIERHGSAALRALAQAERAIDEASRPASVTLAMIHLEAAKVHFGMGNVEAAADAIDACMDHEPDDAHRAQAMVARGHLARVDGDRDAAREHWEAVTRELPDQPASWIAAAALLGPALAIETAPDLRWPPDRLLELATIPGPAIEASMDPETGLLEGVAWLLANQRDDGGWDLPFSLRDPSPAPNPIVLASQAICVQALARAAQEVDSYTPQERSRCRTAAVRALRRYLAFRQLGREHPRQVMFMDYTCWGSSYGLNCVTAMLDPAHGIFDQLTEREQAALRAEADHLVADLVRIQSPNGGWSYYISGVVNGTNAGAAMSFTSATVIQSLQGAEIAGIDVSDEVLARGYACLSSMRGTNGAFEYLRQGAGEHQAGEVGIRGAAARGPVCALALVQGQVIEADAMKPAFAQFVEHLDLFGREARKALMHAGPDAQGSHYLLYDYSTAAHALRVTQSAAVDDVTRHQVRASILHEMAKCRNEDGSFIDNPLIGAAPGTGMAVLTLLDLAM